MKWWRRWRAKTAVVDAAIEWRYNGDIESVRDELQCSVDAYLRSLGYSPEPTYRRLGPRRSLERAHEREGSDTP